MCKVIGVGAAGNKAAIELVERKVVGTENVLLINSTLKDIVAGYQNNAIVIGTNRGGCGKERSLAKELCVESFKDGRLDVLDGLLDPTDDTIYLVSSTEGGTGCGAVVILANYFKNVLNVNVHITLFAGFEEDARGLANTVELFQDLSDEYIVDIISNKKFLNEANGNKLTAHKLANIEYCRRMQIILGQTIVDSEQNIDETDLYKVNSTPGFMTVEYDTIDKNIKNKDQFNKILTDMIDNSKSMDVFNPGAKRIAIILNVSDKNKDLVDYSFDIIKQKLGTPYEIFMHIQNEGDIEFINVIASGMKMPVEEIKDIYEKYRENMNKVDKDKDSFFDTIRELSTGNNEFNSARGPRIASDIENKKKQFLGASLGITNTKEQDVADGKALTIKKEDFLNSQKY